MKKVMSVFLIMSMLLALTSCTDTTEPNTTSNQASSNVGNELVSDDGGFYVSEAEGGSIEDQFSILIGWTSQSPEETMVQQALKEGYGIDFVVENMQDNDYMTTLNMKLSSNAELADIIVLPYNISAENALVQAGRVMNLNDVYYSDKLQNLPDLNEKLKEYMKDGNGDLWWVPGWYAMEYEDPWAGWSLDAWWVRTDLLEQAGATTDDLKTIEGMEETMRKVAALKDENGNAIIPVSFEQGGQQERIIIATFGVDTAGGVSGMPAVMQDGDEFIFIYDNPGYKEAYKWMNKMYREGLIDIEVSTQSNERFVEKLESGRVGLFTTDFWVSKFNETYRQYTSKEESTTLYFEPIDSPAVPGVTKGATSYINPNPGYMIFINKDTKNLNAVLNFLDWVNDPSPYRGHEMSEGPLGIFWDVLDEETGAWDYIDDDYTAKRESGDIAQKALATNEIWQITPYSSQWYPWWTKDDSGNETMSKMTGIWSKYVGEEIVNHRVITDADSVVVSADSIIAQNKESLNSVREEYTAKMIMAESDEKFESAYQEFLKQLDARGKWSEMKEEWHTLYNEQFGN